MTGETLYKILNVGKPAERKVFWEITVVDDEINTKFYYEKSDKIKEGPPTKAVAKNVGKKNETTAQEQALKMMKSKINAKIKEGYQFLHLDIEKKDFEIMSLKTSTRDETWVEEGCFQQPKLDGIRCVALYKEQGWELYSKKHNKFPFLEHIKQALQSQNLDKTKIYDGELLHPDGFQTLINIVNVNRHTPPSEEQEREVIYAIFDIIDYKLTQTMRLEQLHKYVEVNCGGPIRIVESIEVGTWEDINKLHNYFKVQKYEGSVVRHKNSLYVNKRSTRCMKIKDFDTFEAVVVGFGQGVGADLGKVVWTCTHNGQHFDCVPKIPDNEREDFFKNGQKYIGQRLTIQHQGFTKKGVPRFPIGICFRSYE